MPASAEAPADSLCNFDASLDPGRMPHAPLKPQRIAFIAYFFFVRHTVRQRGATLAVCTPSQT
jgi:hypothetical protein